jgi:RND family efflux transporter MFP subunit
MIKVGQRVTAGQSLAQVENSAQKAAVEQAKAGVMAAETAHEKAVADLKRIERLHKDNVATQDNLEMAQLGVKSALAQLKGAEAGLKTAEKMLNDTYIKATISGSIATKDIEQGATLAPGVKVAQIVDISRFKIVINVNERDIQKIEVGKRVTVKLEAISDKEFTGTVNTISLFSGEGMRTFPVEVILDGKVSSELKSGMFASCLIQTESNKDVVIAPEDAVIINNDGSTFSFVFDNGKALKKIVKTGIKSNGKIEIVSGLDKDALVITLGKERLTDGMIVKEK